MATKAEIQEAGKQQAAIVVNNAFLDGLVSQLSEKEKFGMSFPKDYNYANELMGAYLVLKETVDANKEPVLQTCSQISIANTLMTMATMGVSMQKKQCYPVAYKGQLQCQMSVYGNTCIARRYGMDRISAMCIYEGDTFKYHIQDGEIVIDEHSQDFMNINNEKITGAYAVAVMNDGSKHIELMNMTMIKQAWKQGFGYKEGSGTHEKFKDQMCMKTVKNRCLKYIIRTHGTAEMSEIIDNQEDYETTDRVAETTAYDVQQNANTVEFAEVVETVVEEKEPEKVVGEVVSDDDLPDFLK